MSMLSNIVKKNIKGAIRVAAGVAGVATGGVGGLAIAAVGKALTGGKGGPGTAVAKYNPPGIDVAGININLPGFGAPGFGVTSSAAAGGRRGRVQRGPNGECPKGYHLNKSQTGDGQPRHAFCVRNRRVNYANGRAAARSGRRLRGTVKMLRRSFSLVAAKPPKGKWIPKGKK